MGNVSISPCTRGPNWIILQPTGVEPNKLRSLTPRIRFSLQRNKPLAPSSQSFDTSWKSEAAARELATNARLKRTSFYIQTSSNDPRFTSR